MTQVMAEHGASEKGQGRWDLTKDLLWSEVEPETQVTPQEGKPQATDSPTAMSCPGMAPVQMVPPGHPLKTGPLRDWKAGGSSRLEGLL